MWNQNNSWNGNNNWNNNNNYNRNKRPNNRNNNSNNWNNNNNFNQKPPKTSGVTYSVYKKGDHEGMPFVYAWNKSRRRGLIVATVKPYDKTYDEKGNKDIVTVETDSGTNHYYKMIAIVEHKDSMNQRIFPVLMNIKTKVIGLQDIGMCITPNSKGHTASGKAVSGYFGKYLQ